MLGAVGPAAVLQPNRVLVSPQQHLIRRSVGDARSVGLDGADGGVLAKVAFTFAFTFASV